MNSFFKKYKLCIASFLVMICCSFQQTKNGDLKLPTPLTIIFVNTVNNNRLVLNDSVYTNPFKERYSITKLKYYATNIELVKPGDSFKEKNSYHLIDESDSLSKVINLSVPGGNYSGIKFLLGVDSLHNVSGAQTDGLDPAKDMFWTWNSGYVMAKMEGTSSSSKLVNNKFEFHIGGFSGPFNVLQEVHINFSENALQLNAGKGCTIVLNADINNWWQHPNDIKIAEHPAITSPGINAKHLSDNYANMFHIEKVIH